MSDATRDTADGEGVARERNIFRDEARRDDLNDARADARTDDGDRLPWLEAADEDEGDTGVSPGKLAALVFAALIALGIVIGGVWLLRQNNAPAPKDPTLIAAQAGDYKVKPETPGGMRVEGKGDSSFAASEGAEANGKIDLNKLPETPIAGARGVTKADATGTAAKPAATASVAVGKPAGALVAKNPVSASGGQQVQIGAFGTQAKAEAGWAQLTRRHAFLGAMSKQIVAAEVNGATVYRLRAGAGGEASGICAKLRAAGDNCLVVS